MFSSTGELARAVADGLNEFTGFQSFSDNYGPARKYLKARFRNVEIHSDYRDQDLSVAGKRAGAERESGTRSCLIHEALDMAMTGGADLIVAENVPGGHRAYLDLARWLARKHGYRTTVPSAGAWEVGAPHRRERIMLVAAKRRFEPRRIKVVRKVVPRHMVPSPTASSSTGPSRSGRGGGPNLQTWVHEGNRPSPLDSALWTNVTGLPEPRLRDDEGRLNAAFVEWLMGLPCAHAVGLSRTASIRLAGNAVVRLQARLMLQRGLTAINNTKGTL